MEVMQENHNYLNYFAGVTPIQLLADLGVTEPPVNPFEIARQLNLTIDTFYYEERQGFSGQISCDPKTKMIEIWINPLEHSHRQRFTLAHELGHLINDILPHIDEPHFKNQFKDGEVSLRRDGRQDPSEFAANEFAANLLMPIAFIPQIAVDIISEYRQDDPSKKIPEDLFVSIMAKKFQVSKSAMRIRLKRLEIL